MVRMVKVGALLVVVAWAACSDEDEGRSALDAALAPDGGQPAVEPDGGLSGEVGPTPGVTFWRDVIPIAERKCMGCHQPGGIGPFDMGSYTQAGARAQSIAIAVESGTMPPYYIDHDGTCGVFDDSAALTAAETQTLLAWARGGAAEGPSGRATPPPLGGLVGGVDYATPLFAPVAEGSAVALHDEYRCFLIDPGLAQDAFITGFEVTPGNQALVHHLIGFAVDPNAPGKTGEPNSLIMQRLHDASPGREGWPCFGAAGEGVAVAGVPIEWAPGQGQVAYPEGMGFQLKQGHRFVVQVHYNLADPTAAGQTDSSRLRVRYAPTVERRLVFFLPDSFLDTLQAGNPDTLPPGQAAVTYRWQQTAAQLGLPAALPYVDIVGVGPHMHTRGVGQQFNLIADGVSTCAAQLTRWDFHWQKFYFYKPGHYPRLTGSSVVDVTCTFDTRAEAAPVLPGWGTRNEMCLTILMAALPPGA